MTKEEDDWLADFLELAQTSVRQNQATAEKDYATKLKLLTPRLTRARGCDAGEELAKRLAASEALALPSLTVMTMFEKVPIWAVVGVPAS